MAETHETPGVDLDAYLRRIGYEGPREPTLAVLRDLARLHTLAIPFENLAPLLGRPPKLDAASVEAKLVRSRRGGYCFEHNPLLQRVLRALGFEARSLAARVLLRQPEGVTAPRTHALLRVEAEGRSHLVDVGFGGQTPSGPLLLVPGPEQATPHEPCRIDAVGPDEAREFVLQARIAGAWTPLYRFHLFEHVAIDTRSPTTTSRPIRPRSSAMRSSRRACRRRGATCSSTTGWPSSTSTGGARSASSRTRPRCSTLSRPSSASRRRIARRSPPPSAASPNGRGGTGPIESVAVRHSRWAGRVV